MTETTASTNVPDGDREPILRLYRYAYIPPHGLCEVIGAALLPNGWLIALQLRDAAGEIHAAHPWNLQTLN